MNQPRIDQINIVIRQVEAAANFLNGIGIDVPGDEGGWDSIHRNVPAHVQPPSTNDLGEPTFGIDLDSPEFAHRWGGLDPSLEGVVLNVRVDERFEVDELHDLALTLGGISRRAPYDAFWGSRYATVEGPGPLVVGLMSIADPPATHSGPRSVGTALRGRPNVAPNDLSGR